jgi:multiple antibiotic resistance protein
MDEFAFIFTIAFVLLGPIRLIAPFARLTRGRTLAYHRSAALWGALFAILICAFVMLAGGGLVEKYGLSLPALQLSAGLILLLSALGTIFPGGEQPEPPAEGITPLKLAISPLATPTIVPPVGVAAILICVMIAPQKPDRYQSLALALGAIMALDFLVMFFNDRILRVPGLLPVLQLLGGVLIVVQVALAFDTILLALRALGVVTTGG